MKSCLPITFWPPECPCITSLPSPHSPFFLAHTVWTHPVCSRFRAFAFPVSFFRTAFPQDVSVTPSLFSPRSLLKCHLFNEVNTAHDIYNWTLSSTPGHTLSPFPRVNFLPSTPLHSTCCVFYLFILLLTVFTLENENRDFCLFCSWLSLPCLQ